MEHDVEAATGELLDEGAADSGGRPRHHGPRLIAGWPPVRVAVQPRRPDVHRGQLEDPDDEVRDRADANSAEGNDDCGFYLWTVHGMVTSAAYKCQ